MEQQIDLAIEINPSKDPMILSEIARQELISPKIPYIEINGLDKKNQELISEFQKKYEQVLLNTRRIITGKYCILYFLEGNNYDTRNHAFNIINENLSPDIKELYSLGRDYQKNYLIQLPEKTSDRLKDKYNIQQNLSPDESNKHSPFWEDLYYLKIQVRNSARALFPKDKLFLFNYLITGKNVLGELYVTEFTQNDLKEKFIFNNETLIQMRDETPDLNPLSILDSIRSNLDADKTRTSLRELDSLEQKLNTTPKKIILEEEYPYPMFLLNNWELPNRVSNLKELKEYYASEVEKILDELDNEDK